MHKNRHQADGSLRDGDNWQKGIPFPAYMKSAWRHFMEWWSHHRGHPIKPKSSRDPQDIEEVLCSMIFNASGYLHEVLKAKKG